jgi:hypothetical protein
MLELPQLLLAWRHWKWLWLVQRTWSLVQHMSPQVLVRHRSQAVALHM